MVSIKGQGYFLTLAKGHLKLNVKLNFLSNGSTNQANFICSILGMGE